MRCIAPVKDNEETKRLMIYECDSDVYLFLFSEEKDGTGYADYLFEDLTEAKDFSFENYNVKKNDWTQISDPLEHCQHDWIAPARVPGKQNGKPEWGKLEVLRDGKWFPHNEIEE